MERKRIVFVSISRVLRGEKQAGMSIGEPALRSILNGIEDNRRKKCGCRARIARPAMFLLRSALAEQAGPS
jgi:hypothetical protein